MKYLKVGDQNIAYEDMGAGEPILFVHGTPSSSLEFLEVMTALSRQNRCIAIDHLGFGRSDKPKEGDYHLKAHTSRLLSLIEHLNLGSFHLVVHDFGGAIALPILIDNPTKVKSLTLINTWAWLIETVDPTVKKQKWLMTSALMKFCYLKLNFSASVLVKMAWGKHRALTKEHHAQYKSAFRDSTERMGTWSFLNSLFDESDPAWHITPKLKALSPFPVLILWGKGDKLVSIANFKKWKTIFPNATIKELENVGHFVCDEASDLVIPPIFGITRPAE